MSEPLKGVPESTEDTLSKSETVDSAPQHGIKIEPKTFDAGKDSGVGHFEGDNGKVKFVKA